MSERSNSRCRPEDLINGGIYQQLAVTWFPPPHRAISVALMAKNLGAQEVIHTAQRRLDSTKRKTIATLMVGVQRKPMTVWCPAAQPPRGGSTC